MKKLGMVITCLVMTILLVACANKRNDLVLSNFPSIQNELTEKELLKAVGAPHEKSSSLGDVTQLYENLLKKNLSSGELILSQKSNWTVGINGIITDYYVYKLKDGKSVIVFLSKGKVVAITRKGIDYK